MAGLSNCNDFHDSRVFMSPESWRSLLSHHHSWSRGSLDDIMCWRWRDIQSHRHSWHSSTICRCSLVQWASPRRYDGRKPNQVVLLLHYMLPLILLLRLNVLETLVSIYHEMTENTIFNKIWWIKRADRFTYWASVQDSCVSSLCGRLNVMNRWCVVRWCR